MNEKGNKTNEQKKSLFNIKSYLALHGYVLLDVDGIIKFNPIFNKCKKDYVMIELVAMQYFLCVVLTHF